MATKTFTFPVSSETKVVRQGWDGQFNEYLSHADGAVDLSRVEGGTARMLLDHDHTKPVGNIKRAYLENKRLYVEAAFDDELPESKAVIQRLESNPPLYDGVSVRWDFMEQDVEVVEHDDGQMDVTYNRWGLMEVSYVSIPADPTVGMQRMAGKGYTRARFRKLLKPKKQTLQTKKKTLQTKRKHIMTKKTKPVASAKRTADKPVEAKRKDGWKSLNAERQMLRDSGMSEADFAKAQERAMNDNWSHNQARKFVLNTIREAAKVTNTLPNSPAVIEQHGDKNRSYSIVKAIREAMSGQLRTGAGSYEAELHADAMKDAAARGQFFGEYEYALPIALLCQDRRVAGSIINRIDDPYFKRNFEVGNAGNAGSTTANAGQAGLLVAGFDEGYLIKSLYPRSGLFNKINIMSGTLNQDFKVPKETGRHEPVFTEEVTTRVDTPTPRYSRTLEWTWKEITAQFDFSRKIIDQTTYLYDEVLKMLNEDIPRGIGQSLWNGNGTNGAPLGIFNTPGVTITEIGTNGGKLTYAKINDMRTKLEEAYANHLGEAVFFGNASTMGFLRQLQKFQETSSDGLLKYVGMEGGMNGMGGTKQYMLDDMQFCQDDWLLNNGTKGSGSKLSQFGYVVPSQVTLGYFSGLTMIVDPFSKKSTGKVSVQIRQAFDFQIEHLEAVSVMSDIDTSI